MIVNINADYVAKSLRQLADDFPKEFKKAFNTLGFSIRAKIKKVMKKGDSTIAPLHPLSIALKAKGYGGKLQNAIRYKISNHSNDLDLTVGYINDINIAKKIMNAKTYKLTKAQRRKWHIKAGKAKGNKKLYDAINQFLVEDYNKPKRDYIMPVYASITSNNEAVRIVYGRIKSIIEKRQK